MTVETAVRRRLRALLAQVPAWDRAIRKLRRTTAVLALQSEIASLRGSNPLSKPSPTVEPFVTWAPPGHFYSPVPDLADVEPRLEALCAVDGDPAGVDLRPAEQVALFRELAPLSREVPLARAPGSDGRYGTDNQNYEIGDASMLLAMLRRLRPRRYLEVGSGYTTALALDVNERFLAGSMQVTAIEPYPELLRQVTRPDDALEVVGTPVQTVAPERFAALEANDVLFIDSSHVLKTGSDVQFLYGRVLPALATGVYVHVHDIFWPFEYPPNWIREGRAWNEAYLLHAFLACNHEFEVVLWNHYLAMRHREVVAEELPALLENPGGSLWLRRRQPG